MFHSLYDFPLFFFCNNFQSEASTRGALSGYMFICLSFGMFIINVLNTCMPWRTAALFCSTVPVISAIAICFVSFLMHEAKSSI